MFSLFWFVLLASAILNIHLDIVEAASRQKRCIVIQKQSGTHGDSTEADGGEEEYRKPQPKNPAADRLRKRPYADRNKDRDVESVPEYPELLKYRLPMRTPSQRPLPNRFLRRYI